VLQTNDIGVLFAALQAAYGYKWAHKADAIPIWQEKLHGFTAQQVMAAANRAIDIHKDYPPSVGQLLDILKASKPRPTTYLPDLRPPGRMPYAEWKKLNGVE